MAHPFAVGLGLGIVVGGMLGVFIMSLVIAAKRADRIRRDREKL